MKGKKDEDDEGDKWELPCANANIALDAQDTILVDECVSLSDEAHYFVPWSFCVSE
jgi:hypothetical protein